MAFHGPAGSQLLDPVLVLEQMGDGRYLYQAAGCEVHQLLETFYQQQFLATQVAAKQQQQPQQAAAKLSMPDPKGIARRLRCACFAGVKPPAPSGRVHAPVSLLLALVVQVSNQLLQEHSFTCCT